MIDAAGALFATGGYAATTMDAIAAHAGVSRETIFKSIGTKRQLLQLWVERQIAGPTEPVPIAQQAWVDDIKATDDRSRQVDIAAAALSAIHDRAIDALVVLRAAAHVDPEIAELWQMACTQRREDVATVTAALTAEKNRPARSTWSRRRRRRLCAQQSRALRAARTTVRLDDRTVPGVARRRPHDARSRPFHVVEALNTLGTSRRGDAVLVSVDDCRALEAGP